MLGPQEGAEALEQGAAELGASVGDDAGRNSIAANPGFSKGLGHRVRLDVLQGNGLDPPGQPVYAGEDVLEVVHVLQGAHQV